MAILKTLVEKRIANKVPCNSARLDSERILFQNGSKAKFSVPCGSSKRKLDMNQQDQKDKRRKMDPAVKQQCGIVCEALIKHQCGHIFKSPVDPVALKIPDYFSIISHPMDLGTVKSKLSRDIYFTAEEFAADVKLTFSNAMLYNPPYNYVHQMAKELDCIFTRRYKLLETKWKQQGTMSNGGPKNVLNDRKTCSTYSGTASGVQQNSTCPSFGYLTPTTTSVFGDDTRKICYKKSQVKSSSVPMRSMSSEDKQNVKQDLMGILNKKMTVKLQSSLRKLGTQHLVKRRIDLDVNALDDGALWKMKNVLNSSLDSCFADDHEDRISSTNTSKLDMRLPSCGSGLHKESTCPEPALFAPVITATSKTSSMDDNQGVKKALRLAKLTKRYAEIISKSMSDTADPGKLQQETERVEGLQLQEEERIKAFIRDEQLKRKDELQMNHQKEREAFRTTLQMIKRTVEFEDNLLILKEFEILSQCSLSDYLYGSNSRMALRDLKTGKVLNPLKQLGLCIKKEFTADDDEDTLLSMAAEEGEILE